MSIIFVSFLLLYYHNLYNNASSVITTILICFNNAFICYDLVNRRNVSRRRGWLLLICSTELHIKERSRWTSLRRGDGDIRCMS